MIAPDPVPLEQVTPPHNLVTSTEIVHLGRPTETELWSNSCSICSADNPFSLKKIIRHILCLFLHLGRPQPKPEPGSSGIVRFDLQGLNRPLLWVCWKPPTAPNPWQLHFQQIHLKQAHLSWGGKKFTAFRLVLKFKHLNSYFVRKKQVIFLYYKL